ncbi:TetR/AcrR family transcriptional regulator [Microbacterium sp. PMB16]|uniref:TetR/AcrR family transcriptional regulator n=1 Tax=Microbacterium sp. PMB16 TaxID=3120157 RepID=UPI003F4BF230
MAIASRTPGRPAGRTGEDLLAVARDLFLERGYGGTSMEEVAKRAQISKASLYREHPSKTALYEAVVRHWAESGRHAMRPALERLESSDDLRFGLIDLAEVMRTGILSEPVLAMRRLVIAEAVTQPEVARMYLEESWNSNIRNLAATLRAVAEKHGLNLGDPDAAAADFTWLVIGSPLNARLLAGDAAAPPVTRAIDLFLAGYGVR